MSACYECSLCHQQYSDLDPAMMCCSEDKAAMSGLSGQALMSMSQAIRMEERAAIVAWLREEALERMRSKHEAEPMTFQYFCREAEQRELEHQADNFEAGEHLK